MAISIAMSVYQRAFHPKIAQAWGMMHRCKMDTRVLLMWQTELNTPKVCGIGSKQYYWNGQTPKDNSQSKICRSNTREAGHNKQQTATGRLEIKTVLYITVLSCSTRGGSRSTRMPRQMSFWIASRFCPGDPHLWQSRELHVGGPQLPELLIGDDLGSLSASSPAWNPPPASKPDLVQKSDTARDQVPGQKGSSASFP